LVDGVVTVLGVGFGVGFGNGLTDSVQARFNAT